jgi:hypothetical protein
MSDQTSESAQIIPFPSSRSPQPPIDAGQERLRRALLTLDEAVARQREAVATWRSALAELSTVMAGLGESMQRYHGSLDTLGRRVANVHAQAVQLERTADLALMNAAE